MQRLRVDAVVDAALATITDVGDTASVDTTALHEVDYVYRVVVQAAGNELRAVAWLIVYRCCLPKSHVSSSIPVPRPPRSPGPSTRDRTSSATRYTVA